MRSATSVLNFGLYIQEEGGETELYTSLRNTHFQLVPADNTSKHPLFSITDEDHNGEGNILWFGESEEVPILFLWLI